MKEKKNVYYSSKDKFLYIICIYQTVSHMTLIDASHRPVRQQATVSPQSLQNNKLALASFVLSHHHRHQEGESQASGGGGATCHLPLYLLWCCSPVALRVSAVSQQGAGGSTQVSTVTTAKSRTGIMCFPLSPAVLLLWSC